MAFEKTNDIETHFRLQGQGETLILIHGALANLNMWEAQAKSLSPFYRVISYDLRGHGKTGGSKVKRYSTRLFAEDLCALMDGLEINQAAVVGLSLGGMIAQEFAALYPQRVKTLVLCDTAASMTLTCSDKLQTYLFGWSIAPSVRMMGARRYTDFAFWFARISRGENWFGRNETSRKYIENCMRSFNTQEMAKIYDMVIRYRGVNLKGFSAPVLILNGEYESKNMQKHAASFQQMMPQAQYALIPNAGHTSNMENPSFFNTLLLEHLSRIESSETGTAVRC